MRITTTTSLLLATALALPALAEEITVSQKDKAFSRDSVSIKRGESVVFRNDDTVNHDISVKEPDGTRRPGVLEAPGTDTHVAFDQSGTFEVRCLIHPKMKMSVKVE